jgi:hypothetical protein
VTRAALLCGILTFGFLYLVTSAFAQENCMADCTGTGWTLYLNDQALTCPEGAMTEEECEQAWRDVEPQTPPFSRLVCVETDVKREEI